MASRLVLVLGDLFIPDRAIDIPAKFKKLLTPGKIGQILCLGNLTSPSAYNFLKNLAPDLQLVKGDFDIPLSGPTSSAVFPGGDSGAPQQGYPIPTALVDSWNDAFEEYKKYHSIAARGEKLDLETLKKLSEESTAKSKSSSTGQLANPINASTDVANPILEDHTDLPSNPTFTVPEVQTSSQNQPPNGIAAVPAALLGSVQDEGLRNLMMSWYYAGYYTGLYEGKQQATAAMQQPE